MSSPEQWRGPARAPYPPFPRVPPPPPPMRDHPYATASAQSYYAAAPMPGFYSPALAQPAPGIPLGRAAPAFPQPELPPSLMPGRRHTPAVTRSQSDDYFFQGESPTFPSYARQSRMSFGSPPVPRKPNGASHPPLPPKPAFSQPAISPSSSPPLPYTTSPRVSSYHAPESHYQPSAPPLPPPVPHEDDAVFHRVLEMSARESERQREQTFRSEEDQLAQALEASLRIRSARSAPEADRRSSFITSSPEQGPSALPNLHSPVLDISHSFDERPRRGSAHSHVVQQIMDDEALALQLAEEEERLAEQERQTEQQVRVRRESSAHTRKLSLMNGADPLPQYDEVAPPLVSSPGFYDTGKLSPQQVAGPSRPPSPRRSSLGRSISDKPVPPKSPDEKRTSVSRSQSVGDGAPSSSTTLLVPMPQSSKPASLHSGEWEPPEESALTPSSISSHTSDTNSHTQYLDAELLSGLSMGFGTPTISPSCKPFPGVIPNVIALPYGRCPPFHIKAPSWRTLLKLMARLSGTRMEPTMEAMAVVKTEMRLRIVVSFVKVHHASAEWDTVLYMTIDHPIPPNAPTGWRYRNGDTNTLPWSYSLSQIPPFLRDGADAALSKFYTVPCTNETPYPTLPISFPNLATYLAGALETARDAMHDSSSGVRRLAKYVDTFYPSDRAGLDDAPERSGMRQRLKNLVGIGSKPQRDRNAEMYELVTPFVPDDYGR